MFRVQRRRFCVKRKGERWFCVKGVGEGCAKGEEGGVVKSCAKGVVLCTKLGFVQKGGFEQKRCGFVQKRCKKGVLCKRGLCEKEWLCKKGWVV